MVKKLSTPISHHNKSSEASSFCSKTPTSCFVVMQKKQREFKKNTFGDWVVFFRSLRFRTFFLTAFACGLATPDFTTSAQDFATRKEKRNKHLNSQLYKWKFTIISL